MLTLMDLPPHYSGIARVFPVASGVMFPAVLQSVQVKDPIGCAMVKQALDSDQLLAFATALTPESAAQRDSVDCNIQGQPQPEIYRMVCLARIIESEKSEDGYSMSVLGVRRAWIRRQVPTMKPFRMVDLRVLTSDPNELLLPLEVEKQHHLSNAEKDRLFQRLCVLEFWNRELRKVLQDQAPDLFPVIDSMQRLMDSDSTLESLTDLATHSLSLPAAFKLRQLQCVDPVVRAQRLLQLFRQMRRIHRANESAASHKRLSESTGWRGAEQENASLRQHESGALPISGSPLKLDLKSIEFTELVQQAMQESDDSSEDTLLTLDSFLREFPGQKSQ